MIDLIIMQITLVPDSVTTLSLLFWSAECLMPIEPPSWMTVLLQYGGPAQFLNFLKYLNSAIVQYGGYVWIITYFKVRHFYFILTFTIWRIARSF